MMWCFIFIVDACLCLFVLGEDVFVGVDDMLQLCCAGVVVVCVLIGMSAVQHVFHVSSFLLKLFA